MRTLSIETPTHGRVLVKTRPGRVSGKRVPISFPAVVIVGFHGYAQSADEMMVVLEALPVERPRVLVAVQALHRFYTRGDQNVVASWMTRQDRDQAIPDNVAYVDVALDHALSVENETGTHFSETSPDLVFLGFSQGVAMAYRAALLGRHRATGVIAVGGDVPPDVKAVPAARWPRVFVAAGLRDQWYTPDKAAADEAFLVAHGVTHQVLRYDAGHLINEDVRAAVSAFIA